MCVCVCGSNFDFTERKKKKEKSVETGCRPNAVACAAVVRATMFVIWRLGRHPCACACNIIIIIIFSGRCNSVIRPCLQHLFLCPRCGRVPRENVLSAVWMIRSASFGLGVVVARKTHCYNFLHLCWADPWYQREYWYVIPCIIPAQTHTPFSLKTSAKDDIVKLDAMNLLLLIKSQVKWQTMLVSNARTFILCE